MKIYIDLVLLQDTTIMSMVLFIISKLIGIKIKMSRMLMVSFFSSIASILILMFLPTLYDNLLIKFALSFFIVKYGFGIKEKITILQKVIIFWMITFFLAGINIFSEGSIIETMTILGVMSISMIAFKKKLKKQLFLEGATCFLEFWYNTKRYYLKALLDTGHEVKTIYGEDVIFIRKNLIEEGGERLKRIVSYKTISGRENKLGIKIDNIKIEYGEKKIYANAVIVGTPNISQNFDAIVGYDLIEGGMKDGNTSFNEAKSQKAID